MDRQSARRAQDAAPMALVVDAPCLDRIGDVYRSALIVFNLSPCQRLGSVAGQRVRLRARSRNNFGVAFALTPIEEISHYAHIRLPR